MLFMDSEWTQVMDVFALPRRVIPGWFNRLASLDVPVDICFYYTPLSTASTMRRLQRKHFEAATTNEMNSERGKLQPANRIAQSDIEDLMNRIVAGQDRFLEFSMYLMVRGETKREVQDRAARIRSSLQSMLLIAESRKSLGYVTALCFGQSEHDISVGGASAGHNIPAHPHRAPFRRCPTTQYAGSQTEWYVPF